MGMSGKAERTGITIKNVAAIIFPLVFSSMGASSVVSNTMFQVRFRKHKKRTWYMGKPLAAADYAVLIVTAAFFRGGTDDYLQQRKPFLQSVCVIKMEESGFRIRWNKWKH